MMPPALRTVLRSLLSSLPGRLFLLSAGLLLTLAAVRVVVDLPPFLNLFRQVVSAACLVALGWLGVTALIRNRRRLLWRVRRKLILSYVFLGLVPFGVPAIFLGLGMMVCVLQAFVFSLLTMIYVNLALQEAH